MNPNPTVDSALHVLKGAVQRVLDAKVTTGVFADGNRGRLTVEFDRKPTDSQMAEIESLANLKITEDVPIENFEMDRATAERELGTIIYDRFPVPKHVKTLSIVRIAGWNVNCCVGPHLESTGGIGGIRLTKWRARPGKGVLEISFEVGSAAEK